jgi:hypothetical protein
MILISHRGNINGKNDVRENSMFYIMEALTMGFDVEIDVWYINNEWFLGHDKPQYQINIDWVLNRKSKLWVHCKNTESVIEFYRMNEDVNFFWHQEDLLTITSAGYLWVYPGNQPLENTISVLPELYNEDVSKCIGICSDYIIKYKTQDGKY